jgi:hypothetical protein
MRFTRFVAALVLLSGCRDNSPLQQNQPTSLNAMIVDGANADGNKDFFFLPPLVANPVGSANYDAGKFNSNLSPFVEVCRLAGNPILDPLTSCGPLALDPARMSLDASNQQYQLNWDTKASLLDATAFYRITVRGSSQGTALGFLDVDPVLGGMKNAKTGEVFIFQDGRTMPIKVRIEQGAFGSTNASDAVEQVVPNVLPATGLDVTTNTRFAGAHFSNGWLPIVNEQPLDQVVVIIERVPITNGASCLNTGLEQLEGCYRFRTDPDLHTLVPGTELSFRVPVIAGVCFQYPADIQQHSDHPFELYRSEEVVGRLAPAEPLLDEVPAPFLRCDTFGPTPPSIGAAIRSGRPGDIAKAGLFAVARAIGRVIEPTALHAVDLGAGGSTNEFSRFGYVRPATMTVTSGDGAVAPAGSTVQASVRLQNHHSHGISEVDEISAVVGQSVTFTVPEGSGGTVSTSSCSEGNSCVAITDADGVASVTWRLGGGPNTLQASTAHVTNSPQTLVATGTAGNLVISSFTRSFANPTVTDDIVFTAEVQNAGTSPVPASSMTLRVGEETFPPVTAVPALTPGQTVRVSRVVNLDVAQGYTAEAKADVNSDVAETNETDNNSLMSFVVTALQTSISDASGDATAAAGVAIAPDLVSGTARVDGGNLTLQLRFATGTFDQNATMATVVIDVDQNAATGFPGVDDANNDASSIGTEYNLEVGSQSVGSTATLFTFAPGVGFTSQKLGAITYVADGADVVLPLSALGRDRGEMSFKVIVQTQISFPPDDIGYTGIVDYMTDIGQAPGSLVSHPIVIGLLNPTPSPRYGRSWSAGVGQ